MQKIIWRGNGLLEWLNDGEAPPALTHDSDVRIRVTAAGVCSTDVHIVEGSVRLGQPPLVLGHEIAGVVDSCGSAAVRFRPGDRVKCDSVIGCGECGWCRQGATQFCPDSAELGITCDGGWAKWLVVPERNLYPLPDEIPDSVGAILDVEVFGALRKPGVCPGDTVAVFGPGPAGLIAVQLARIMGAGTIILCGTRPERLCVGLRMGADYLVDSRHEDAPARVREMTQGRGADLVFEAAGTARAVLDCLNAVRPQGKVVLYGVHGRPVPEMPVDRIVLKDVVVYGALSNRTGWEELIGLVARNQLNLAGLITHTFPLSRAADAVALAGSKRDGVLKTVLRVDP